MKVTFDILRTLLRMRAYEQTDKDNYNNYIDVYYNSQALLSFDSACGGVIKLTTLGYRR